ncbi:hypothetical protein FA15DRAFT_670453 [Coprinopsis marcescibilis]|uniref:Nephrocystin 3-like N-terminal domain-containing protein n=1 Tax=Coprinopsis marcescibilis TaxID=230819 RepID=A0A5C3KUB7_COPMA|nr:hypothetical protein FA15DRAFT_670453 [Coprinopsis marcescibilis]
MERSNAPRCAQDTREEIQFDVTTRLRRPIDSYKRMLWLKGSAGSGKSAVAQSVAESCEKEGILAATFFFSYRSKQLDNYSRFITTIAYQLALTVPFARSFIGEAIVANAAAVTKDIQSQLRLLILEPLVKARRMASDTPWPKVVIIDGLDECQDEKEQAAILDAVNIAFESGSFPFHVFIVSQPETEMRKFFSGVAETRTHIIDINTDYKVDPDIEIYMRASFRDIHMKHQIDGEWPTNADIRRLVEDASGHFVYASTVMKHVDDPSCRPQERLEEILKIEIDEDGEHPLSPLDALYASILNRCSDPKEASFAIQVISELDAYHVTVDWIHTFLRYSRQDCLRVFGKLHSLLEAQSAPSSVSLDDRSVYRIYHRSFYRIHHKSLIDFLQSGEICAKGLYVPLKQFCTRMCVLFFQACEGKDLGDIRSVDSLRVSLPQEEYLKARDLKDTLQIPLEKYFAACDLKDPQLSALLIRCDVDGWAKWMATGFRPEVVTMNVMYSLVHSYDLGCNILTGCGAVCKRWRSVMTQQWTLVYGEKADRPVPTWIDRFKYNWKQPLPTASFEWHDVFEPEYPPVFVYRLTKRQVDEVKGRSRI